MLDSHYRHLFQRTLIDPVARVLVKLGASPIGITLLATILGVAAMPFIALGHPYWGLLLLIMSGYCDALDGTLARISQETSDFGATCDICSDRLVEFSTILGLYLFAPNERGLLCILMLGSILLCITTFLVVGIFSSNSSQKSFHYSPGLMERTEAFILFAVLILFPVLFIPISIAFTTLVSYTGALRLYQFRQSSSS